MRRGGRIRGRGLRGTPGSSGAGSRLPSYAGDRAEPSVLRLPVGPGAGDLVVGAADEVPPHDELLLERLAADQQQPGPGVARDGERVAAEPR